MAISQLKLIHPADESSESHVDESTHHQVQPEIQRALRQNTKAEVRFNDGDRALYATDGSNYRFVPIGIVIPRSLDDVIATMAICSEYQVPVLPRGGGTDL